MQALERWVRALDSVLAGRNMDARGLANQARSEAQRFASTLSREVVARIERAVIAEWPDAQDEGHLAAAAVTARQAMADLRTYA